MSIYLYKDNATELYVFKYKGFVFNPKPGSMMLIERESDGFVNLQAVYDNKAFRQNTNGHILNDFVDPQLILDGAGVPYGATASLIRSSLSDFFVDAPASTGATDLLGGIAHDAAAPTPGVSGKYYFTSAGVVSWISGTPAVSIGDEVIVVYNDPDYTYTHLPVGTQLALKFDKANLESARSQSTTKAPTSKLLDDSIAIIEDAITDTVIHPAGRDTQEFTNALAAGWWTDKDNWFDGVNRKFTNLNVRSYANSIIVVAFFKINGSVSEKIAEKNVNVTIGINSLSLSQIIDNQSLIVSGEKYYIFCRNLSTCIRFYDNSVNNNAYYIATTNEAVVLVRNYDFSFWITTKDNIIISTEKKKYLFREPVDNFDIITEIGSSDYVFIPPGVHELTSKLNFRANQKIEGIPGKSIIRFTNNALTICAEAINISNVTIQGVTFEHIDADTPLTGNGVSAGVIDDFAGAIGLAGNGTHVGLHVYNCRSINIIDCTFRNFNSYGVWLRGAGADYFNSSALQNVNAYNCYIGINVTNEGEYISFNGLKLNRNQIGMVMNAGNNTVVNSHIDGNRVGLLLLNAANGAHGSFGTSTFNHNSLYGVASNLVALGESFVNCQHWHGDIYVKDSKGLVFSACVFGSTDIYADGNYSRGGMWIISDSVFRESTITVNHNYNGNASNLILKNNHYFNASNSSILNN